MLTAKQKRFVEEYLVDSNAKQAAIRAGYSPRSAEFQGCKLLADSKVSQEIKIKQKAVSKKLQIKREDLIQDLIYIKDKQKDVFPPSAIAAIKEIGRFLGFYEPDKLDVKIEYDLQIPGLDIPQQSEDESEDNESEDND